MKSRSHDEFLLLESVFHYNPLDDGVVTRLLSFSPVRASVTVSTLLVQLLLLAGWCHTLPSDDTSRPPRTSPVLHSGAALVTTSPLHLRIGWMLGTKVIVVCPGQLTARTAQESATHEDVIEG